MIMNIYLLNLDKIRMNSKNVQIIYKYTNGFKEKIKKFERD